MKTFTADSLRQYLDARRGSTFITLFAATLPKMRVTNNPYNKNIIHLWGRNVIFGANYENSVNRRLAEVDADGYFRAESLWKGKGERINQYMARHTETGDEYLVYLLKTNADGYPMPHVFSQYRTIDTDEVVPEEELRPFFFDKAPSRKQMVEETGARETFPRTVLINGGQLGRRRLGVLTIKIDGRDYFVKR